MLAGPWTHRKGLAAALGLIALGAGCSSADQGAAPDVPPRDAPAADIAADAPPDAGKDVLVREDSLDAQADLPEVTEAFDGSTDRAVVEAVDAHVAFDSLDATADATDAASDATADATDAASDASDTVADGDGGSDPCAPLPFIDLNRFGMLSGGVLRYTGNTRAAPTSAPFTNVCMGNTTSVVALRYTPRTTNRLRVSTNNADTTTNFDTIAWAQVACTPGAASLGCNDDASAAPRPTASTFITATPAAAAVPIYIFIAGPASPASGRVSVGAFGLTVIEYATIPAGMPCDLAGVLNACATGALCARVGAATTCVADGARGGRCRSGASPCDAGLVCSTANRCATVVGPGEACEAAQLTTVCAVGSTCRAFGGATLCYADGAAGGRCRTAAGSTPCAVGLVCGSSGYCVPYLAAGATCDPDGVDNLCQHGLWCPAATSVCALQSYAESVLAAPTFVNACTDGRRLLVTDRDDGHPSSAVSIGFPFEFFGEMQTRFWPSTNGYGVFGTTEPADALSPSLPLADEPRVVAPFLSDLVLRTAPGSDLCSATVGVAPARRFVAQWNDVYAYGAVSTHLTFELILNEAGYTIDFLYQRLDPTEGTDASLTDGSEAAIGITSASETVTHLGRVQTTRGIRFTPR